MRIVAGRYGGRRLLGPSGKDIRPTSDKVRGSIFNALASLGALEEAYVLDGFCGTGALGLEALSRGGRRCDFYDLSFEAQKLAKANAAALGLGEEAQFIRGDVTRAALGAQLYDLVFFDPPYHKNLVTAAMTNLLQTAALKPGGVVVMESEKAFDPVLDGSFSVHSTKTYGDIKITIARKI